ncbi:MAG: DUF456 domain-containing protein [Deltaproteobacteria bacterium]|jgi:uncharacterized protein YqgC (DUF456 family)|nr:DUF456 domain-containing protein [Deltaproteobacteria bacterium]
MTALVLSLCLAAMLVGVAGSLLPILPGLPLIWLAYLAFGLYDGWQSYGRLAMIVVGLTVAASVVLNQVASLVGAKKFGAGRAGIIGAVVCAILGVIFFSLPGLIIGTFAGATLFEMVFARKELKGALAAGTGALLGFLCGGLCNFMLALAATGAFVWLVLMQ